MAWTAPRTWVAGEVVTAAIGNTHWRDNLLAVARPLNTTSAQTLVTSTAAETTLYTFTVPAATLAVGAGLRLTILGQVLYNDGAQSITFRIKIGGTSIFQDAIVSNASANSRPLMLDMVVGAVSTTTVTVSGGFNLGDAAAPTTGIGKINPLAGTYGLGFGAAAFPAYTLANATAIAVTIQHSVSSALLSVSNNFSTLLYTPPA